MSAPPDTAAAEAIADFLRSLSGGLGSGLDPHVAAERAASGLPRNLREAVERAARRWRGDYHEDEWGFDEEYAEAVFPFFEFLYERWWRVEADGLMNVPSHGRAMIVSNHAGSLFPFDASMITGAIMKEHPLPRWPKFMVLNWAFVLPFLSGFMRRVGGLPASPHNAARALEQDNLVMVFPEGVKGTGKPFSERYRLQRFGRGGFVEVALRARAQIVPVAVVGSEEIYPMIANSRTLARIAGAPFAPITPTFPWLGPLGLIPLPSKWRIEFCSPIDTSEYGPEAAEDRRLVFDLSEQVRETIQAKVYENLVKRGSAFVSMIQLMSEPTEAKDPTEATRRALAEAAENLPAENDDAANAARGFVGGPQSLVIRDSKDQLVWDMDAYGFLADADEAPDSVHPSLWRHARIDTRPGLYEVAEGVYQVRSYDVSNMTLVEGEKGVVVVDPLISMECARAALDLYFEHRGEREVTAVVYSHSHADHFAGVKGIVDEERVRSGEVTVWAPENFLLEAVSENVLAGNAMVRRGSYMFGNLLGRGARGQVGSGIGFTSSDGHVSLIPPTEEIHHTGQWEMIDGVRFEFQLVPETEAPAELNFHLPERKALYVAEIATHTHHNVLTLRGAQVRDALGWSKYLNEAVELFAADSEVLFHGHHWPTWGREELTEMLKAHRDLYRYVHDQTLRLMNQGHTPVEIAAEVELAPAIAGTWSTRGYYGTVSHNVRAVYQRFLGFFDGVPAHLDPLPPAEAGKRYVDLAGGAEALLAKAREAFDAGDYRWVAEITHHLVFAEPDNQEARELEADALEQMGYQSESAIWRNYLLTGALELRAGNQETRDTVAAGRDVATSLPVDMVFDAMGSRLNGPRAWDAQIVVNWDFTDIGEQWVMTIENGALSTVSGRLADDAHATIKLTRGGLDVLILDGPEAAAEEFAAGRIAIEGEGEKLAELLGLFDFPNPSFDIVTP